MENKHQFRQFFSRSLSSRSVFGFLSFAVLLISFQNCSKNQFVFNESEAKLDMASLGDVSLLVTTELNVAKDFLLPIENKEGSFSPYVERAPGNGKVEIIKQQTLEFRFHPNFGFRGQDQAEIVVKDFYGNKKRFLVKIMVGNPFANLEPALAVRGVGCITCHSSVSSDIITDFGYGDSFYFSANAMNWKSGGMYGDHGQSWHTLKLGESSKVVVPEAQVPSQIVDEVGSQWLDQYLKKQLALSSNPLTASAPVVVKSTVRIGAPTSLDLREAFRLTGTERMKYFFDESTGSEKRQLEGFVDKGRYFSLRGSIACDGDVYLAGPVLIENLVVHSKKGCRIYVDGSIFLYGSVLYSSQLETNNLQLVSTKSINLGLGSVMKNGSYCDENSYYFKARQNSNYIKGSSLVSRYQDLWTTPSQVTRAYRNPTELGKSVVEEAQIIEKGEGSALLDAECRSEGRKVAFNGVLLNAPYVHNRYNGDFKGTIIAETGLMSLGTFVYSFDPVFSKVPVIPFLKMDSILKVQ